MILFYDISDTSRLKLADQKLADEILVHKALADNTLAKTTSTYSKNRDHLNIVTLPFHSGEKHTNSTG